MEKELFRPCVEIPDENRDDDLELSMTELDNRDLPSVIDLGDLISYCSSCSCCC